MNRLLARASLLVVVLCAGVLAGEGSHVLLHWPSGGLGGGIMAGVGPT